MKKLVNSGGTAVKRFSSSLKKKIRGSEQTEKDRLLVLNIHELNLLRIGNSQYSETSYGPLQEFREIGCIPNCYFPIALIGTCAPLSDSGYIWRLAAWKKVVSL